MGQASNSGRNASLDSKKQRAAGRGRRAIELDFDAPAGRGKTLGAFGKSESGDAPKTKDAGVSRRRARK